MTVSFVAVAVGNGAQFRAKHGDSFTYSVTGTFDATVLLQRTTNGGASWETQLTHTAAASGTVYVNLPDQGYATYRYRVSIYASGTVTATLTDVARVIREFYDGDGNTVVQITEDGIVLPTGKSLTAPSGGIVSGATTINDAAVGLIDQTTVAAVIGAAAQPSSGSVAASIERLGNFFTLRLVLTAARIPVTDGAGSGSYGSVKIFDFIESGVHIIACHQRYSAYAEGAALTTAAGDAAFAIGVGTTAISAAADGVLAAANRDVGASVAQTNSGGTTTGISLFASNVAINGTVTASDLYLNWSGTAATIDASSTIDVTGVIFITGVMLGDFT